MSYVDMYRVHILLQVYENILNCMNPKTDSPWTEVQENWVNLDLTTDFLCGLGQVTLSAWHLVFCPMGWSNSTHFRGPL